VNEVAYLGGTMAQVSVRLLGMLADDTWNTVGIREVPVIVDAHSIRLCQDIPSSVHAKVTKAVVPKIRIYQCVRKKQGRRCCRQNWEDNSRAKIISRNTGHRWQDEVALEKGQSVGHRSR